MTNKTENYKLYGILLILLLVLILIIYLSIISSQHSVNNSVLELQNASFAFLNLSNFSPNNFSPSSYFFDGPNRTIEVHGCLNNTIKIENDTMSCVVRWRG